MNTALKYTCLFLCGISLCLVSSQASPPAESGPPGHETRLLQHLLEMNSSELANLRATIERIEKMSAEEKELLRKRIGKMREMDPVRVEAMREKYKAIPEDTRQAMRKRWMTMSSEERIAWREKLESMSQEERQAVFESEGFLPSRKGKKGHHAPPPAGQE